MGRQTFTFINTGKKFVFAKTCYLLNLMIQTNYINYSVYYYHYF